MEELLRQLSSRYGVPEATLRERAGPELERLRAGIGGGDLAELFRRPEFAGLEARLAGMFAGTPLAGIAGSFNLGRGVHEAGAGGASEVEQAAEREQDASYAREDGAAGGGARAGSDTGFSSAEFPPQDDSPQDTGDTRGVTNDGGGALFMAGEGDAETAENVNTDETTLGGEDLPAEGPNSPGRDDADAPLSNPAGGDGRERRG